METRKVLNEMNQNKVMAMLIWTDNELVKHVKYINEEEMYITRIERLGGDIQLTTHQVVFDTLPHKLRRAGMPLDINLDGTKDINGTVYEIHKQWKAWSKDNEPITNLTEEE